METSITWRARRAKLSIVMCVAVLAACGGGDSSDGAGGDYMAYLADGHMYPLAVDLEGHQARFSPVQPKVVLMSPGIAGETTLTLTGTRPVLRFGEQLGAGATARLVVADDLVIGNAPLQGRVTPFVAVNTSLRSVADAAGDYNVFGVTTPAAGDYLSAPMTWRIEATGQLQVCAAARPIRVAACPAGSLTTYSLHVDGDDLVASSPAAAPRHFLASSPGGDVVPLRFRVAYIEGDRMLLLAGGGRFAIGLPDTAGAFRGGRSQAPSTDGAWAVVDHSAISYSSEGVAVDGSASNFVGSLSSGAADSPAGVRLFDKGSAFVMQDKRLTVLLGQPGTQADGYLQIGLQP